MARKITTGRVGRAVLGNLTTVNNSLQSVVANADVLLEPNGTGITVAVSDLQINSQSSLRLADSDSSNYIALRSPATVASNITYTFPGSGVIDNGVLKTNTSGELSWELSTIAITNQTADATIYYPTFAASTSGRIDTVSTSDTKLDYQPSTGRLRLLSTTASTTTATGALVVVGGVGIAGRATINNANISANTASTTTATGALVVVGGVGIGGQMTAASIVETSSITLKENILPIDNALDSILKLSGVTYDRIDTNEHEAGLIAEWTAKVLPDLVTTDSKGNAVGIKYTKLTAYLIESIKTLKLEIDQLKGAK